MSLSIIQISDTHIQSDPEACFDEVDCAASLEAVLAHINTHEHPDIMLLTGDLVHDPDAASYQRLQHLLKPVRAPVYVIPGNHDEPDVMQQQLGSPVRHDRVLEQGGWRVLLLNSWLQGEHAGHLHETELDWLDSELGGHADTPSLIALHHPPVSIDSPWMDAMGLQNGTDFLAIIDRHPQVAAVIWGHIHQVFESERHGVKLLGAPSTCVQFKPASEQYAKDDIAPGYRWLTLLPDGSLETGVKRVEV